MFGYQIQDYIFLLNFFKTMIDKTSRTLTDDGKLLISYSYETVQNTEYQSDWNSIYNL